MIKFLDLQKINLRYQNEFQQKMNAVLDKGWFVLGDEVKTFETNFANYCGSKYCVGVGNGFEALVLIFKAYIQLGQLKKGDEVVLSGGIIAKIVQVDDNYVKASLTDGVVVTVQKNSVTTILPKGTLKSL